MTQMTNKAELLKRMFAKDGMSFSKREGWSILAEHVDVHHRNLEQELEKKISWDEALFSWYENVYFPLKRALSGRRLQRLFPDAQSGDIYLAVSDHWYYLKEQDEDVDADLAVGNYIYETRKAKRSFINRLVVSVEGSSLMAPRRRRAA